MISARNHRPLLSGNKWLLFIIITLLIGACSPKIRPVVQPQREPEKPVEVPKPIKQVVKPPAKMATVAMLLPFGLDHFNPGASYTDASVRQADLSLDYYQGFKLALDSLTAKGYNYKLQLFDTKGTTAYAHSLAYNPQVRASDLIVGPVFPDDIKAFASVLAGTHKLIVSPLAPSDPSLFKNQNMVTAIPPLDCHAWAAARYVTEKMKPRKIFILRSGFSDELGYITPLKKAIDSLGKKRIAVAQFTIVHGQLTALLPQLSTTNQNIFVIPATNQAFLMLTLRTLDSLSDFYPITVIGHPNWQKFTFLKAETLQKLDTYITSTDVVDYKSAAMLNFLRVYRKAYHIEPSDYAIKGFDEGMYFGGLLGENDSGPTKFDKADFTGLHNTFHFTHKIGLGWVNTHVNVYHYANFELKQVE
jgi:hypothetical protein